MAEQLSALLPVYLRVLPKTAKLPKLHGLCHVLDEVKRYGPLNGVSTEVPAKPSRSKLTVVLQVFESANKRVRRMAANTNRHNLSRDVARALASRQHVFFLAAGGLWRPAGCDPDDRPTVHLTKQERTALNSAMKASSSAAQRGERVYKGRERGALVNRERCSSLRDAASRLAGKADTGDWACRWDVTAVERELNRLLSSTDCSTVTFSQDVVTSSGRPSGGWVQWLEEGKDGCRHGMVVGVVRQEYSGQRATRTVVAVRAANSLARCATTGCVQLELLDTTTLIRAERVGPQVFIEHDCNAGFAAGQAAVCCPEGKQMRHGHHRGFVVNRFIKPRPVDVPRLP